MLTLTKMKLFHEAFNWLDYHPDFTDMKGTLSGVGCLAIDVVKVNPETEAIDDDIALNTKVRVWLEGGPWEHIFCHNDCNGYYDWTHDIDLDCGADTYEEAIIKFAQLVFNKYGNYTI